MGSFLHHQLVVCYSQLSANRPFISLECGSIVLQNLIHFPSFSNIQPHLFCPLKQVSFHGGRVISGPPAARDLGAAGGLAAGSSGVHSPEGTVLLFPGHCERTLQPALKGPAPTQHSASRPVMFSFRHVIGDNRVFIHLSAVLRRFLLLRSHWKGPQCPLNPLWERWKVSEARICHFWEGSFTLEIIPKERDCEGWCSNYRGVHVSAKSASFLWDWMSALQSRYSVNKGLNLEIASCHNTCLYDKPPFPIPTLRLLSKKIAEKKILQSSKTRFEAGHMFHLLPYKLRIL